MAAENFSDFCDNNDIYGEDRNSFREFVADSKTIAIADVPEEEFDEGELDDLYTDFKLEAEDDDDDDDDY